MTDDRIEKIKWATTQPPYGWLAKPALEVIREMQQHADQLQAALDVAQARVTELEAELTKRDNQDELWRLVKVWRTRADEEYQRAEAAEARERAKDEALRQTKARLERGWPDAAMRELQAALARQPADNGSLNAETGAHRHCSGKVSASDVERVLGDPRKAASGHEQQPADQPAQGERDTFYMIRTNGMWWRPCGAGYTSNVGAAGLYPLQEALDRTCGLGSEKHVEIIREDAARGDGGDQ